MYLTKKQKLILDLLVLQEVNKEQNIVKYVLTNVKNGVRELFLTRKTEEFISVLIEKRLWRDEAKFREFFRFSWDQ